MVRHALADFVRRDIEPGRRHRLVGHGFAHARRLALLLARLVVVEDQRVPLGQRLARQMVEHERRVGQVVEQRVQLLVVERQPVLHAGEAPAFAHRRIERIVTRRRAERLDVVAAETADRLRRQRHFAHRLQRQRVALAGGALRGRIEGADRLQRVAEEVEPQRLFGARRVEVEDAAAHREFADVAHGRHALEAGIFQPRDQHLHVDLVAGPRMKRLRLDDRRRRHALQQRVGGGQHHGAVRLLAERGDRRHRIEPACRRVGARRDAVVGQAVPGRQLDDRQFAARRMPARPRSAAGAGRRAPRRRSAPPALAPPRRSPSANAS